MVELNFYLLLLFSFARKRECGKENLRIIIMFLFSPQIEDLRQELHRKEQELLQMCAKMKTVEEQHADYQKHIAVLKESLIAKEEHYNMLQLDVSLKNLSS